MINKSFIHFCKTLPENIHPFDRMIRALDFCKETGFHWSSPLSALDKIREELSELEEELENGNLARAEQELGDVFHAVLHMLTLMQLDSTKFLMTINEKFENRLQKLQELMEIDSVVYKKASLDEKLAYWKRAKKFDRVA